MKTPTHVFTRTGSAANEWAIDDDVVRLQEWGTDKSHVLPLPPTNECTVGAAAVCAIRLEDPSHLVSRLHARLIRGETGGFSAMRGARTVCGSTVHGAARSCWRPIAAPDGPMPGARTPVANEPTEPATARGR